MFTLRMPPPGPFLNRDLEEMGWLKEKEITRLTPPEAMCVYSDDLRVFPLIYPLLVSHGCESRRDCGLGHEA